MTTGHDAAIHVIPCTVCQVMPLSMSGPSQSKSNAIAIGLLSLQWDFLSKQPHRTCSQECRAEEMSDRVRTWTLLQIHSLRKRNHQSRATVHCEYKKTI